MFGKTKDGNTIMTELISVELFFEKDHNTIEDLIKLYYDQDFAGYLFVYSGYDSEWGITQKTKKLTSFDQIFDEFGGSFMGVIESVQNNYNEIFCPFERNEIDISDKQLSENEIGVCTIYATGNFQVSKIAELFQDDLIQKGITKQWTDSVNYYFQEDDPDE
jgi:hypothetical protein